MKSMLKTTALAAGLLFALPYAAGQTAGAAVIYDNGVAVAEVDSGGASQRDVTNGFDAMSADDFTLGAGQWLVTDVHWFGVCNSDACGTGSGAADTAFNIVFYADDSGKPTGDGEANGAAVRGTAIRVETHTVTGVDTGSDDPSGDSIYEYTAFLDTPLLLQGGTPYWLSLQAVFDAPPQWFWAYDQDVTGGASFLGFPEFLSIPYWTAWGDIDAPSEFAFSLTGEQAPEEVPEPGTLALLGLGLAGLGVARRRRAA